MHPILARIQRLGLYLLAWIPLAGLLAFVLAASGNLGAGEALAVAAPLALVYAFVCLSAWYPCRMIPLGRTSLARLLLSHAAAAVVSGGLWTLLGRAAASALAELPAFAGFGERFTRALPVLFGMGVLFYLLSVALHYVLLALEASRQAEGRAMEARVLARDAELRALKAQVNPHFLFNSLNSISALTSSDPARARQMCVLLAEFLRCTLGLGEQLSIPLAEELDLVRCFLAVEQVRFGARLNVEEMIEDECRSLLVPPLLLQPLIENAITHGIANLPEGGWIRLEARRSGAGLSIVIENAVDPEAPPRRKNGVGLSNVRKRLEARYGERASLEAGAAGDRYRVLISLPAETQV